MQDKALMQDEVSWGHYVFCSIATAFEGVVIFITANIVFRKLLEGIGEDASFKAGYFLMGAIVLWFLMVMECFSSANNDHTRLLFFSMVMITNIDLIGTIYLTIGVGTVESLYIGALLVIIATPLVACLFWFYQRVICLGDNFKKNYADWFVIIGGLLDVLPILYNAHNGFLFSFDSNNTYIEGSRIIFTYIYPILVLILCMIQNIKNKNISKRNHITLAIFALVPLAFAILSIIFNNSAYSHSAFVIGLLIVYTEVQVNRMIEISTQKASISVQKDMLEKDSLTQLYSRFAYARELEAYDAKAILPSELVVFAMDVNGLKGANDTKGHEAGDELIKGSADCIDKALSAYGKCFRTGGDEFVAILNVSSDKVEAVEKELRSIVDSWHGKLMDELSISIGAAAYADHKDLDISSLIKAADKEMYADKERYYAVTGRNRRK